MLRIHALVKLSEVNGPGRRCVIWVQGCNQRCTGCFNPETQDFSGGFDMSIRDLLSWLPVGEVDGITFSGGEPFLQAAKLADLAAECRSLGLNVMVYSGFTYEELLASNSSATKALLNQVDILVDGPYMADVQPNHRWAGSGNQRVIYLKEIGEFVQSCLNSRSNETPPVYYEEICISAEGNMTITGF